MNEAINAAFRPIADIGPATGESAATARPAPGAAVSAFSEALADAVSRVNAFHSQADSAVQGFLSGQNEDLHKIAVATQQAELSFDLFLQVKNRVVQAYQEVMRMQL